MSKSIEVMAKELKLSPVSQALAEDIAMQEEKQISRTERRPILTDSDANAIPTLVVELGEQKPVFMFEGEWRGKDVLNVLRHLRRAYMIHIRDIRRKEEANHLLKLRKESTHDDNL